MLGAPLTIVLGRACVKEKCSQVLSLYCGTEVIRSSHSIICSNALPNKLYLEAVEVMIVDPVVFEAARTL